MPSPPLQYQVTPGAAFRSDCLSCPNGKYNPSPGATSCAYCGNGKYSAEMASMCTNCAPGKSSNVKGAASCPDCIVGKYTSSPAQLMCLVCPSGTNGAEGSAGCSPCSPGTVTLGDTCEECQKGKYAEYQGKANFRSTKLAFLTLAPHLAAATSCSPCAGEGEYSGSSGAVICSTAPAGYRPNEARDGYEKCAAGRYSLGALTECVACPDGAMSSESNTGCIAKCNPGEVPVSDNSGCEKCVAGKFATYGAGACLPCDGPGEYADEAGSPICKTAPAGTKPRANRTGVELCPKNTFSIGANSSCTACPVGGHSKPGSSACQFCGQFKEYNETMGQCYCVDTFVRSSSDGNHCTCPAGMTLDGTICVLCEKAKWKGVVGAQSCTHCDISLKGSMTLNEGSTTPSSCICPAGTFDYTEKGRRCEVADEGSSQSVDGMTLDSLVLERGYWRSATSSLDIRQCRVEIACEGGSGTGRANGTRYCRDGHHGPYCDVCDDNFSRDAFGLCQSCEASIRDKVLTIGTLLFLLVVLVVIMIWLRKRNASRAKMGDGGDKNNSGERKMSPVKRLKNGFKILIAAWQIISCLPTVVPAFELPENVKSVVEGAQILSNPFILVPLGCWSSDFNFYHQLLGITAPIIAVCGALFAVGLSLGDSGRRCVNAALAILYLMLPTLSTTIFQVFPCDELDDDTIWLRADYTISCKDQNRPFWILYGWVMVVLFVRHSSSRSVVTEQQYTPPHSYNSSALSWRSPSAFPRCSSPYFGRYGIESRANTERTTKH